jgi:hypothetical protein
MIECCDKIRGIAARVPGGDVFDGKALISRDVLGLVTLIPIASGVWWLTFFNRKDVKTYFTRAGKDI